MDESDKTTIILEKRKWTSSIKEFVTSLRLVIQ